MGGLAAALELTATAELRERFEVTVYQAGWRLGGKGASSRNEAAGNRIEEHGLHIWFGFYDNAFRVMRDVYEELGRAPGAPLAGFGDVWLGLDEVIFYETQAGHRRAFPFRWPVNGHPQGEGAALPSFWEMAAVALGAAHSTWRALAFEDRRTAADEAWPQWFAEVRDCVHARLGRRRRAQLSFALGVAGWLAALRSRFAYVSALERGVSERLVSAVTTRVRDWLWSELLEEGAVDDVATRLFFCAFDILASTTVGIVSDKVLQRGFDSIDDEEFAAWLARHGAKPPTVGDREHERSSALRAIYDVAFGYVAGSPGGADVAAGVAIQDLLRLIFSYRGHFAYKMRAGMGEAIFAPIYELLRRRGVHFAFFHAVTRLGLAPGRALVAEIDVVPQVGAGVDEYEPLVSVDGLPCWPSEPLWEQLPGVCESKLDFERSMNPLDAPTRTLRHGIDFDDVVLGIPVPAVPEICAELIERDSRFARAVECSETVATQAFQIWMRGELGELGWPHHGNSIAGGCPKPVDVYCDMSHLLAVEDWPREHEVRSLAYFCGVFDEQPGEGTDAATARVKQIALDFLDSGAGTIWPRAVLDGQAPALRWELLADPLSREGSDRFDGQYWRVNLHGSDRYVLSTAGSIRHRLRSDDSGFENLVLAGDWTRNGIDGGCVEAATISGLRAGRALSGSAKPILGEDSRWLLDSRELGRPWRARARDAVASLRRHAGRPRGSG
jgi:uncharacterized protein with NAD-binding domain and iron-sulfur cluster